MVFTFRLLFSPSSCICIRVIESEFDGSNINHVDSELWFGCDAGRAGYTTPNILVTDADRSGTKKSSLLWVSMTSLSTATTSAAGVSGSAVAGLREAPFYTVLFSLLVIAMTVIVVLAVIVVVFVLVVRRRRDNSQTSSATSLPLKRAVADRQRSSM